MRPLQTDHVRRENRTIVFRTLLSLGTCSRSTLADATGLSIPTVTAILDDLSRRGVVRDEGRTTSTGGRPARQVAIEPNARHVLIVDLSRARAVARRIDLLGGERERFEGPDLAPGIDDVLVTWVADLVRRAPRGVASVTLIVPGVVNDVEGTVVSSPNLGWTDRSIAETWGARLGVPIILHNDVHAMLLAETTFGAARGVDDVLFVTLDPTLGSAMIVGGVPVRGAHGAAGRIGFVRAPTDGPSSGGSDGAAQRTTRADRKAGPGEGPLARELRRISSGFLDAEGVVDLSDADQREAFGRFATTLRSALQPIASALDPSTIVIAWSADPHHRLVEHMNRRWSGGTPVSIVPSTVTGPSTLVGAGVLALNVEYDALCTNDVREDA